MTGVYQDGLDVSNPDVTTPEEIAAYRAQYTASNKGLIDSFEFWLEFRPDVLKRHKARTRHFSSVELPTSPLAQILTAIHQYTIMGFREDIAVRIMPDGPGARIDLRSSSRYFDHDLGSNAEIADVVCSRFEARCAFF